MTDRPRVRALTVSQRRAVDGKTRYPRNVVRPETRGDCAGGARPCPWVSCKFNLYLDVDERNGSVKINFPHLGIEELPETCALDVADRGGSILEEVGTYMNLTRERSRQIEVEAGSRLRLALRQWHPTRPGKAMRSLPEDSE